MRLKIKNSGGSIANLERRIQRKLLESQFDAMDIVNPNEAYIDPGTGEQWLPLGIGSDLDVFTAPFTNELELRVIRQRARVTALKNPYAKNLLNSITAFVVGKGHRYTAAVKKNIRNTNERDTAKKVGERVQKWLDKLLKINKWPRRQRQTVWRYHRDGEAFTRMFHSEDGYTLFRFVEPAEVLTPAGKTQSVNCTFGIETDPDDVETVEYYWIGGEKVPAEEIQHRKANVDMNTKRGLSTLFTIREHLDRALKLLRNMSITVANQTALSMIRHHKGTGKQVQSFAAKAAQTTRFTRPGPASTEVKQRQIVPGTTWDVVDGKTRVEFPAQGLNAGSPVQILQAELRAIASAMSWPEFMIGADSSNANYSSTMVAENPAVKSIETEQADHIADDLELIQAAIENAVNVGRLPAEALTMVEIEVEAPLIVTRNEKDRADISKLLGEMRVKSPQTTASEFGLDYAQEQQNFTEHDDQSLDDGSLNDPLSGGGLPAATDDIAKTALNGAQVTALANLIQQAAAGLLPVDSLPPIIRASFPNLDESTIEEIVRPLEGFKATPAAKPESKVRVRRRKVTAGRVAA